jgi:Icc-related predicted phosphoesterase
MRIACVSDVHCRFRQIPIPPCDVLVVAGDITWRGEIPVLNDFAEWCSGLLRDKTVRRSIVAVAGNHDVCFDPRWLETSEAMVETARCILADAGVVYLEDSWAEIDGLVFYGSPWTRRFGRWCFATESDEDERRRWSTMPDRIDVLVTHSPPAGILDWNDSRDARCGSRVLRDLVLRAAPKLHVFGHLHPGRGVATTGATTFVNAASMDKDFKALPPIVIDLIR